jgi:hypothetical protein
MKEQIKKFLNEEQDPKAIEKITPKLEWWKMKKLVYSGSENQATVFPIVLFWLINEL